MRGLRSTIALLVVLAGLGAYIYFVASKAEDSSTKQDKLFSSVTSDNIEELTVKNDAGETTTLKKADGKWMMTAPFQTRASDMDASGIANAPLKSNANSTLSECRSRRPAAFLRLRAELETRRQARSLHLSRFDAGRRSVCHRYRRASRAARRSGAG